MDEYSLLGRTGLRVAPFCLGAMNFGDPGWGSDQEESQRIFDRYREAGGNFVDTANIYAGGRSEEVLGRCLASDPSVRDRMVVATKFSINPFPGDPNAGGNGRKNIIQSLEASLRRLGTDYIDLYWVHFWDSVTPAAEVVDTLDDLVRAGKIRYVGLSDVPAWYAAQAQTYATLRGRAPIAGLQLEHSLIDRTIENEHVPAAQELGIGVCAWGPLCTGMLTGKYKRASEGGGATEGRIASSSHYEPKLSERNFSIVDALVEVAEELGRTPAQVALNWVAHRPGITSTIVGARTVAQLDENLPALEFALSAELAARLDEASAVEAPHLYDFFTEPFGPGLQGATVRR